MIVMCCALLASTFAGLRMPSGAAAATPCADAILDDWYHDGRIDRFYALPCYQQAIDAVPSDIRPYTDAPEVIARAFQDAFGRRLETREPQGPVPGPGHPPPPRVPPVATSSPSAIPLPLLVLAGLATTLLVAGGLGYLSRRREHDLDTDEPDRPRNV